LKVKNAGFVPQSIKMALVLSFLASSLLHSTDIKMSIVKLLSHFPVAKRNSLRNKNFSSCISNENQRNFNLANKNTINN